MRILLGPGALIRRAHAGCGGRRWTEPRCAVAAGQARALASARPSILTGPSELALYTGTIPQHLASVVARFGERPAVIARAGVLCSGREQAFAYGKADETTLTYSELDVLSNRLASSLTALGVRKDDRVAIMLGNKVEFAALTYAVFKLGAVLVPLNPVYKEFQVAAALRHLDASLLVIDAASDLPYSFGRGRGNAVLIDALLSGWRSKARSESDRHQDAEGSHRAPSSLRNIVVTDNRATSQCLDSTAYIDVETATTTRACGVNLVPYDRLVHYGSEQPVVPSEPLAPSDTINIQFTSGTTSAPKAAMLTHTSILNNGLLIAHRMGLVPAHRIAVPPPLFHCFVSVLGYMATATTGAAILFPSPAFEPMASLRMCTDHAATGLYGVPTMLISILDVLDRWERKTSFYPDQADGERDKEEQARLRQVRHHLVKGIVAGSTVPESLVRTIHRRLGLAQLVICYGMTETSPVSCMTAPSDPLARRTGSVGRPMPHTTVKIVSTNDRSVIVPRSTRGELATAGYLVMQGYYHDAERTAQARVEEPDHQAASAGDAPGRRVWMYSGDEAVMDDDGFVSITARIKDLIIRGGENIYPAEIEDCLYQLPGVNEVSVIGMPDDRLGEIIVAFVVKTNDQHGASLSERAVRDWVRSKLSSHLVPKHTFWLAELPKTASGKTQKFILRDHATKLMDKQCEQA